MRTIRTAPERISRRRFLTAASVVGAASATLTQFIAADETVRAKSSKDLRVIELRVTPIVLPDPPLLASGGCHGPYFLRNVIELRTEDGMTGIGETHGGQHVTEALEKARQFVVGHSAFAYQSFAARVRELANDCYAGIEMACLDAIGRATGRRLCELLGGRCESVSSSQLISSIVMRRITQLC